MAYAIYRQLKIKSLSHLVRATRHNERKQEVSNADPNCRQQNVVEASDDPIVSAWKEKVGDQKIRKNGVLAVELLCGFSPEARDWISPDRWLSSCKEFVAEEFGGSRNIIHSALHMDEKTPHCHFIVVPLRPDNQRLSASFFSDGSRNLATRQTRFAQKVGVEFNLLRGDEGSRAKHIPPSEYRAQMDAAAEEAPEVVAKRMLESAEDHARKATAQMEIEARARKDAEIRAEQAQLRAKRAEAEARKQGDRLREMDLFVVMQACGFEAQRVEGKEHIFETEQGFVSINPEKQKYSCDWSRGGGGAIDLAKEVRGLTYGEAIQWLASLDPAAAASSAAAYAERFARKAKPVDENARTQHQIEPDDGKLDQVRNYLISRHIDPDLVDSEIEKGNLWANRFGSCVFIHPDPDHPEALLGAEIRGTLSNFKAFAGRKGSYVVADLGSDEIAVVESAIDALSLRSLGYKGEVHSAAGSSVPARILAEAREGKLVLAFDDDQAGRRGCDRAKKVRPDAKHLRPPSGKDWNGYLSLIRRAASGARRITSKMIKTGKRYAQYIANTRKWRKETPAGESVSRG
tara:strand:- start:2091 stop:3812 length:1722 start_codon:yes stop_codon:yes gene_type:complete